MVLIRLKEGGYNRCNPNASDDLIPSLTVDQTSPGLAPLMMDTIEVWDTAVNFEHRGPRLGLHTLLESAGLSSIRSVLNNSRCLTL